MFQRQDVLAMMWAYSVRAMWARPLAPMEAGMPCFCQLATHIPGEEEKLHLACAAGFGRCTNDLCSRLRCGNSVRLSIGSPC